MKVSFEQMMNERWMIASINQTYRSVDVNEIDADIREKRQGSIEIATVGIITELLR